MYYFCDWGIFPVFLSLADYTAKVAKSVLVIENLCETAVIMQKEDANLAWWTITNCTLVFGIVALLLRHYATFLVFSRCFIFFIKCITLFCSFLTEKDICA